MANDFLSWMEVEHDFANVTLTVRAQALPPLDTDRLLYPIFFPEAPAPSVKLSNLLSTDFRPAADRREWNQRGRLIPIQTPRAQNLEMIPVESYFKVAEYEIQNLVETTGADEAAIKRLMGVSIPARVDALVNANRRRIEFDCFEAWAFGTITALDPQTAATTTVSYGFDVTRYTNVDWVTGPYAKFIAWVEAGADRLGAPPRGAITTRNIYEAIRTNAPQGLQALKLTRSQFEDQVTNDLGFDFTFYIAEHQLDKPTTGGVMGFTRTRVWPAERIALVPAGVSIGTTRLAPIARAYQIAALHPDAEVDVRGMSVFKEIAGNGREATFECQINAFPVPDENNIWVNDTNIV